MRAPPERSRCVGCLNREPACDVSANADDAEWTAWVRRHDHTVVLALLGMGVRVDRARELAHEAWARLYERQRRGELTQLSFPGLAIAQARYLALDELRRQGRTRARASTEGEITKLRDPAPDAEARLLDAERLTRAERALARMPERARQVFTAVYDEPGVPHVEVAQRLGLSVQRLRQTLCEVRARLRAALEDSDGQ